VIIRRYLTEEKFDYLLDEKKLYLPVIYKIEDEWEHIYLGKKDSSFEFIKNNCFISCWNKDHQESTEMWDEYVKKLGNNGVVIESTVDKLEASLYFQKLGEQGFKMKTGNVKYKSINEKIEYISNYQDLNDLIDSIFRKRKEKFKNENEFRILVYRENDGDGLSLEKLEEFVNISFIDRSLSFIDKIIISPCADNNYKHYISNKMNKVNLSNLISKITFSNKILPIPTLEQLF